MVENAPHDSEIVGFNPAECVSCIVLLSFTSLRKNRFIYQVPHGEASLLAMGTAIIPKTIISCAAWDQTR